MKLLFSKNNIPFARWAGEFIVVVLGVLGALAVDEYQNDRAERELERDYLIGFQSDLTRDGPQLARAQYRIETTVYAAEHLLLLAGANLDGHWNQLKDYKSPTLRTEFDPSSVRSFSSPLVFSASKTNYITITSNGDLRTIQDHDLRSSLIQYYAQEISANRDNAVLTSGVSDLISFLLENGIDLFNPEQARSIAELPGVIPYLSKARDQEHWRLRRLQGLQETYDTTLNELNRVVGGF